MKRLTLAVTVLATLALSSAFTANNIWKSDKAHSGLGFSITHLGISDVTGNFNDFDVIINSTKEDFSDAIVEAEINVASINTGVEARDKHLQTEDFFNAAKYPKIIFKSTGIKKAGKNSYKLNGNLTLKGITKPVVFDLMHRGNMENPNSKKTTAGFKLSGVIKRSDYGIAAEMPTQMLSDEVAIVVNSEFNQ